MQISKVQEEKKRDYAKLSLTLFATVSLFSLYLYFLRYFSFLALGPMTTVDFIIFYTMIVRVLGFTIIPFLRKINPSVKIFVFSSEVFVLCGLILTYVFTLNPTYSHLMASILTSWLSTCLIVLTPYSIYQLALIMYKGTTITALLTESSALLAICLYSASLVFRFPNPSGDLGSFGQQMITSLRQEPNFGGLENNTEGTGLITVASVIFFLSFLIYVTLILNKSDPSLGAGSKYPYVLVLILIGVLILYVWILGVASILKGDIVEILSVPSVLVPIVLWVISREREK